MAHDTQEGGTIAIPPHQTFVLSRGRQTSRVAILFRDLIHDKDKDPSFSAKQTRTKGVLAPISQRVSHQRRQYPMT
jgi:hypothetical protein